MFVQIWQGLDQGDGILPVVTVSYALLTEHTAQERLTVTRLVVYGVVRVCYLSGGSGGRIGF